MVHEIIDEHADVLFVPREFICVELGDVQFVFLFAVIAGVVAVGGVFGTVCPMVCAIDNVFAVNGFDDVDFAASGPAGGVEVFAEHPEGGPNAFTCRERNSRFYRAVLECKLAFGKHTCRSVLGAFVVFFLRTDMQNAVLDVGVFFAVGVIFFFVVAPAACTSADVVRPFAIVNGIAIEFIVPERLWRKICGTARLFLGRGRR